ncbi:MAG: cell division protein FtsZ, partial [Candidatus Omnitrophica bacterium]|nr:cell division protein FtsZ [Candidatus Omnitrophota bacterium]
MKKAEEFINETDNELQEMLLRNKPVIKVVGVGGAGNNTINRLYEVGITDAELIAVNTDAQDLLKVHADSKVLIGKTISKGLGAGADPSIGRESAEEGKSELKKAIKDANIIFVTCGLGGGTGTGAIPVIARLAREQGILCTAVVTLPFSIEGKLRMKNAYEGFENLKEQV